MAEVESLADIPDGLEKNCDCSVFVQVWKNALKNFREAGKGDSDYLQS